VGEVGEVWASATVATLAFVLAAAGRAKLSGSARRAQGGGELVLAAAALIAPVRVTGGLLAVAFAGFAVVHAGRREAARNDGCDCFGEPAGLGAPAGPRRLALTAVSAALAAAAAATAAVTAVRAPLLLAAGRPVTGLTALAVAALAAQLWRSFFAGPGRAGRTSDRLVSASAQMLERRFSRRGLLVRLAAVGSALTVAPLRYLLYPGSALAAISPDQCAGGACTDGYTAFCCQINHGFNSCPTGTFPGGWWMCTDYPGRNLCAAQGVRYYVDCNALPGQESPGGCRCANGTCDEQRVACNIFRYGQCNPQIGGVTAVVCRMVVCENPSQISELHCSASLAVDDSVCEQDAGCLEPAIVVGAAGGV
jgi:hypothetical protein